MKTAILIFLVLAGTVLADAKADWMDARQASQEAQSSYHAARADYAKDSSAENEQAHIDAGKYALNAALAEAEAWLIWRKVDVEDNEEIPSQLQESILDDVDINLDKIQALRAEVDSVDTRFDMGIVFLRMVGKYFELVTDVARNSGLVWSHIATTYADRLEGYIDVMDDSAALDSARTELQNARDNIQRAEEAYGEVRLPGTPLIKFAEGNRYLRAAKANMLASHKYLNQAYRGEE